MLSHTLSFSLFSLHRLLNPRFPFFSLPLFLFLSTHLLTLPFHRSTDRPTAMNQIDQSLDDLIKKQREQKKKMKGNTTRAKDTKIPKKQAGGVKSRAAIRTDRAIRAAKPNSPYAVSRMSFLATTLCTQLQQQRAIPCTRRLMAFYLHLE